MPTTETYNFNPGLGDVILDAFSRCQVKRTELTPQHIADAKYAANFLQIAWANDGLILWTVDKQTIDLIPGTATYSVPSNTVMILDLYVVQGSGGSTQNRLIMPFSRTDYASLAQPNQVGFPTSFWFDRLVEPTVTFWPVPNEDATSVEYYRYRQIQDADVRQGTKIEIPYLWLDAFAAGLAHRLSRSYAPNLEAQRKMDYQEAYLLAAKQGTENVGLYLTPGLIGYFE